MTTMIRLGELDDDYMLTDVQAAEYLNVEPSTLRYSLRNGKIPATKVGRYWRIRAVDLRAYLGWNRNTAAAS